MNIDFKEFRLPRRRHARSSARRCWRKRRSTSPTCRSWTQPEREPVRLPPRPQLRRASTGYRARSMLTVPMLSARTTRSSASSSSSTSKRRPARPCCAPERLRRQRGRRSTPRAEELALALASQAGICLENAHPLRRDPNAVRGLRGRRRSPPSSRAIRPPPGHSRRVATLTVALAEQVDARRRRAARAACASRHDDLRQIEYAGVLHDFGKVGVRENVLVKAKKLYEAQREAIVLRFELHPQGARGRARSSASWRWPWRGRAASRGAARRHRRDSRPARWHELDDVAGVRLARPTSRRCSAGPAFERLAEIARLEYVDARRRAARPTSSPTEVAALQRAAGQPHRGRARRDREPRRPHLIPARPSPGAARSRTCRASPARTTSTLDGTRLPAPACAATDIPRRVAHDDHRRHLRRADRVRPPVQEGRARPTRPRHHRERGEGRHVATPSCSACSWAPRSTGA